MTELFAQIDALLGTSARDLDEIERTLTDGYAQALSLEAEQWRRATEAERAVPHRTTEKTDGAAS